MSVLEQPTATPLVLLTVPHSRCPVSRWRVCDLNAENAAVRLRAAPHPRWSYEMHRSPDVLRETMDFNRPQSWNTSFRRAIRARLRDAAVVLDMHSFPRGSFTGEEDADVVVLDNTPGTEYGAALARSIAAHGVRAAHMMGDPDKNTITQEARDAGVPAVLIEYGEHLDDATVDRANAGVHRWLERMLR